MRPPFHRLEEFVSLGPEDVALAEAWCTETRTVERGGVIRREGDPVDAVFFLMAGWVGSSLMPRSEQRQIVKVHLPGDMLGFPSLALTRAGETLEAISDATFCTISKAELGRVFRESPRLTAGLFLSTQKERYALTQKLSWIGRSRAIERLASFLLDLHVRLSAAELVEDNGFELPLTQHQIGDMLGLTSVYVNRSFKQLDDAKLIARARGRVTLLDVDGLRALAVSSGPSFNKDTGWITSLRPAD